MSSLVTEILSSAGKLEKEELGTKISTLTRHIDDIKAKVQESLQMQYVKFLPSSIRTKELENEVITYSDEIQSLTYIIQNELSNEIQESSEEFQAINKQLVIADTALQVVKDLIAAHENLQQCDLMSKEQNFVAAVSCLLQVDKLLSHLHSHWDGHIKVLSGMRAEYLTHSEKLKYDMGEIWNEHLKWSIEETPEYGTTKDCTVRLTITKPEESKLNLLLSLVRAMHLMQYLDTVLKIFSNRLQKYVFHPIIVETTMLDITSDSSVNSLQLIKKGALKTKPTPENVFEKLSLTLEFLNNIFGELTLNNVDQTLMHKIGTMAYQELRDTLVKECLSQSIPSHRKDLAKYDRVVEVVIKFHGVLIGMGFVQCDDDSILKYARNVDSLFAIKMCQTLLCKARKIMLEDLYDHMPAQTTEFIIDKAALGKSDFESYAESDSCTIQLEFGSVQENEGLHHSLLQFPQCHISKSTLKLLEMLYRIMQEAVSSSPSCAARLLLTARNIIVLYCDIVPCYHKNSLESFPQQSALMHNNCMYIAHHLMTIGHQFKSDLPGQSENLVTFIDLVPKMRNLGVEVFLAQMRSQKQQILDILGEVGDFRNMLEEETFFPAVQKAFKQCLLKMEHLAKVWQEVLPENVFRKALGTLLNTLIEEVIMRVTSLEDLPEKNAVHLINIFGLVKEKAPSFFKTSDADVSVAEIARLVPKWMKFQELLLILDANMQDILDRWSSGKGPLAQEFTVEEVKQLIRALFQNTDRRAAVLSKIK